MTETTTANELRKKVDILNYLYVNKQSDEQSDLLVINASGVSENENTGVPKLILTKDIGDVLTDGILEFNFVIQTDHNSSKNKLAWDVSVVYQMDVLPKGIKAIKVNAAHNADIAILLN